MALYGCDTFVVLPPLTAAGDIVFGKNSDRPDGEVQEVVLEPSKTYTVGEKLQCTYIEIDQALSTHAVLLSKPAWMWGAEMGANECGVVIGNEAVWTVVDDDTRKERLLGMDLLRLGLERSSSSSEAVDVITTLLEEYGQGGLCSDVKSELYYHNSFLIADHKEAWVLETAGKLWAAERVVSGHKNISNCLSIGTDISRKSNQLVEFAKENKLWSGEGEMHFRDVFSSKGCPREAAGRSLLVGLTEDHKFDVQRMFQILRDKPSEICRCPTDPYNTTGSWVSSLSAGRPACHWVTATPDPSTSVFKPFVFSSTPAISPHVISPIFLKDPAKIYPRFQFAVDRRHNLYKLKDATSGKEATLQRLATLEQELLEETSNILSDLPKHSVDMKVLNELFKNAVEREVNIYIGQNKQ